MSPIEHYSPSVYFFTSWKERQDSFQESATSVHSRLYPLEPEAMGSLWQESFTSYLNRLGWTHHVSPRAMVMQEVIPHLDKKQGLSPQWLGALSRGSAMNMNGIGSLALEWSKVLGQLTQRSDLHLLTLYGWIGNLSSVGHLRPCLAWCPICYAEWQEQEMCIYQPLLWLFKVVTTCPKHQRVLESRCPHCQKQQSVIALRTLPGYCTQCDRWLGSSLKEELPSQVTEELTRWQQWVLKALEELHAASIASGVLQWEPFFAHLALCLAENEGYAKVANLTHIQRNYLYKWVNVEEEYTPTLETILKFCYVCNVTPLQVMQNQVSRLKQVIQREIAAHAPPPGPRLRHVNLEQCQTFLQAVLDGHEKPQGLRQIGKHLGYTVRQLSYHFPKECALITPLAQEYRRQRKEERLDRVREQVRQAVVSLHAQGIYPSLHKVQSFLSAGVMMQPEARETWHAVLRELEIES